MPNSVEYVLAFTGATGVGMTVTTFNPAYTAAEVSRQILTSKAKVMLTSGAFEKLVLDAIKLSGTFKLKLSKVQDVLFLIGFLQTLEKARIIFNIFCDIMYFLVHRPTYLKKSYKK